MRCCMKLGGGLRCRPDISNMVRMAASRAVLSNTTCGPAPSTTLYRHGSTAAEAFARRIRNSRMWEAVDVAAPPWGVEKTGVFLHVST